MLKAPSGMYPMSGGSSVNSSATHVASEYGQESRSDFGSPPGTPNTLVAVQSHTSRRGFNAKDSDYDESEAKQYERFSPARKVVVLCILSYCAFLAPISSTAMLSAVPEIAKTYQTTEEIINASTALYLAFMGVSSLFWGPLSQVCGRRPVSALDHLVYI